MSMPISYSRMSVFENCPQRFDYQYVSQTVKDQQNEYSIYGSRIHLALENYAKDGTPLGSDAEAYKGLVDKVLAQPGEKLFEHEMAIRRDKTPCGWTDGDAWVRGIADVLVVNGDRAWCLDWKTGKPKDNPTQLQLFAALTMAHFPAVRQVVTSFIWLNYNSTTDATYTKQMEPHIWLSLEPRVQAVLDAVELGVFKTKPSGLCPWCPAKDICPDARLKKGR